MVDRDLISNKLALIETLVRELRVLGHPDRIDTDVREEHLLDFVTAVGSKLDRQP